MDIINQDLGGVFEPVQSKTDIFMKVFLTFIIIVIELVMLGVVTNLIITNNPELDSLTQGVIVGLPILVAIGLIFLIWRADIIHDGDTVF